MQRVPRSKHTRWLVCTVFGAIAFGTGASGLADPLDKVTGMEDWKHVNIVDREAEWEAWYRARVSWRQAVRELQLEQARNMRLARLQRRGRSPRMTTVRQIVRAPLRSLRLSPKPPRAPKNLPRAVPDARNDGGSRSPWVVSGDADERSHGGRRYRDRKAKQDVPVEDLIGGAAGSYQVVDDEAPAQQKKRRR